MSAGPMAKSAILSGPRQRYLPGAATPIPPVPPDVAFGDTGSRALRGMP